MATINIGSFGNTGGFWVRRKSDNAPWSTSISAYNYDDSCYEWVAQPKAPEKKRALTALDWLDGQVEAVCAKGRL